MLSKAEKERIIEKYLRLYRTYLVGIKNCQKQLDYIMPSLVSTYGSDGRNSYFVVNNTERVTLDRLESKRAIDLREEIEQYKIITNTIEEAFNVLEGKEKQFVEYRYFDEMDVPLVLEKLGYAEEKSLYRIRRMVLDKFLISLSHLLSLK